MQQDLFGEPARDAALSQCFTPLWLARRLVRWIRPGSRVLEPACGSGNLIAALLERDEAAHVEGVELDLRWVEHVRARFNHRVRVLHHDFLTLPREVLGAFDVTLMNPKFEDDMHTQFVLRAFDFAPVVIGVFPSSFEFGQARDNKLWSTRACVTHRARLPERVDYGWGRGTDFDSVALRIIERRRDRRPGEQREVVEEVWRRSEAA